MVVTDMFMTLTRVLPKTLPTTFGTPELVDQARATGRKHTELLLPPVDIEANAPGVVDATHLTRRLGVNEHTINVVTVSRLNFSLKFESIARTINAVGALGSELPLRLIIVGDGEARPALERLSARVNHELGRCAVVFAGEMLDPRAAYVLADIVVGMGGSALRAMAFGKPVIIVGEDGFAKSFTQETADYFFYHGIFGRGSACSRSEQLIADIRWLAHASDKWPKFGDFARQFVVRHFSVETVSARLSALCESAVRTMPDCRSGIGDGFRSAAIYLRERLFLRRSVDRTALERSQSSATWV
jgi:glycosyltransferase involved in cell wall biosynthesis